MEDSIDIVVGGTRGMGRELVDQWRLRSRQVIVISSRSGEIVVDRPIGRLVFFQRWRGEGNEWDGELETSLTVTKKLIEDLHSRMVRGSAVVVVSSVAADRITDQPVGYHVAKAGLNQLVRFYAVTLGPLGIRVNSVAPGFLLKEANRDYYGQHPQFPEEVARLTPMRVCGTSQDVLKAIEFLSGPDSGFITGQNLVVDGGLSLGWPSS